MTFTDKEKYKRLFGVWHIHTGNKGRTNLCMRCPSVVTTGKYQEKNLWFRGCSDSWYTDKDTWMSSLCEHNGALTKVIDEVHARQTNMHYELAQILEQSLWKTWRPSGKLEEGKKVKNVPINKPQICTRHLSELSEAQVTWVIPGISARFHGILINTVSAFQTMCCGA